MTWKMRQLIQRKNKNPHDNDMEDEVVDKGKNCDCDDKVNKALVNSLATCSQTLSTIENCKVGKVSSIGTSKEHVVPCTCNKALTAHLVKSLKSCTQAVETLTKCKKGGEGHGSNYRVMQYIQCMMCTNSTSLMIV